MRLGELIEGRLVRRYKRFLADVELPGGDRVTAHCPNTGSMRNCAEPGSRVWLHDSCNPARKYPLGWKLVEVDGRYLTCIDTGLANALVAEAIEAGVIGELAGYRSLRREVPYGAERSRIDLQLSEGGRPDAWVEVKMVTLLEDGWGCFPDAVTARGQKHLRELMLLAGSGQRAVLLFCVSHQGIARVRPADSIDPEYGRLLRAAAGAGVEVLAYGATLSVAEVRLVEKLPVVL
ncbi:sugar fermentation stimulation protein [Marinobacterium nitratireducens]|uniref:Sugar fermentation stimulation protein homolog n=1 Tax=Marinobacterium nitratireducens TaxID=518897 RepID=A0A917ZPZ6_9GAMM|nr:DNA/RNA nuclease SfsA [Marinobacterium nitratireducens]GGO88560.1 sugar fermentation stimulation protein [Marinobacterium nitratireducens]